MSEIEQKPLYWSPDPSVGYAVMRRPDGGMNIVFSDVAKTTLEHWRRFALDHLIDSDRLTTNLYDLSQIEYLPDLAIQYAIEVNNDPSVRNIRMAVVVGNDQVRGGIQQVAALTTPGGVEMEIFEDAQTAETWLARPLTNLV
jgi:hypothetical protein